MGFLDSILKRELSNCISNALAKAIDTSVNSNNASKKNAHGTEAAVRSRIEEIVARDFPSLELREDIPAQEMNAKEGARNYTYGLYLDIMLLEEDNHNLYRNSKITKAKRACENAGVPYMNFMLYMSNRPEYIARRFQNTIVL